MDGGGSGRRLGASLPAGIGRPGMTPAWRSVVRMPGRRCCWQPFASTTQQQHRQYIPPLERVCSERTELQGAPALLQATGHPGASLLWRLWRAHAAMHGIRSCSRCVLLKHCIDMSGCRGGHMRWCAAALRGTAHGTARPVPLPEPQQTLPLV
jgi:hypothetical protein